MKYLKLDLKFHIKNGQWKAFWYRVYINIFNKFLHIPIIPLSVDKLGIEFYRKGESIIYVWKSKRKPFKYLSLDCGGGFHTLKEVDNFWKQYFEACQH